MKKLLILILLLFSSFVFATDMNDFKLVKTLNDHFGNVNSVSFSHDSKYLAFYSWRKVIIYDTKNWEMTKKINDHSSLVKDVLFSNNGKYFASYSNVRVKIYSTNTWQLLRTLTEVTETIKSVSFSPDSKYIAFESRDNIVTIYNTNNWQLLKTSKDHSWFVDFALFSPDGKYIVSDSDDNTVRIYDTNNKQLIKILRGHSKDVTAVSFSSDGKYFVSGSNDNTVIIYETNNWQLIKILRGHSKNVTSVSFSSDGRYLASGSKDNTIKIYSVPLIVKVDVFIKSYVENHINEWQKKGEFEKTVEYKERMSNRDKKAEEFFNEAKNIYEQKAKKYWDNKKEYFITPILVGDIQILGNYDADRETYKLNISTIGDVVINIPINHAKSFKENENKLKLQNPKVVRKSDEFVLSSIEIYNPVDKKSFIYNPNKK